MDHLRDLILQLERDQGKKHLRLRRTFNALKGGKRLVGAFNNSKKGKKDVYGNIFTKKDRVQNCEEECKGNNYFLLHDTGKCGCSDEFNGEHGKANWEWEYGTKHQGF